MLSSVRNSVGTVIGFAIAGFILSGCGGGSGASSVPVTPQGGSLVSSGRDGQAATTGVLQVSSADRAAAANSSNLKIHEFAAQNKTRGTQSLVYPADLSYQGGPVLPTVGVVNGYVDSTSAPFGNVKLFETDLSKSNMIHITDQYVGATANNRYPDVKDVRVTYPAYTTLGTNDLLAILHKMASGSDNGYTRMYNVFLPPGLDFCETGTTRCSASSTSPSPAFCAFHGSVTYGDIGHVLFSLEPFQDRNFCAVFGQTQNDATYSTLSHEMFETITDPDPPSGWYNFNVGIQGEIGDICAYIDQPVALNGHTYNIQTEYSNRDHGCNNSF